jgi:hypothetical protein
MPPVHPPLKNDGPACRVCGCTEHNACPDVTKIGGRIVGIGCHWVELASADARPLCSACAAPIKRALASGR